MTGKRNNTKEYADYLKSKNVEPEAMNQLSNRWTIRSFGSTVEEQNFKTERKLINQK